MGRFLEPLTAFVGPPLLVEEADGTWLLSRDLTYVTNAGKTIVAREGLVTDFASIPKPFRWLFSQYNKTYGRASVIHDWLCRHKGRVDDWAFTSREVHLIFREAMQSLGASWFTRSTMSNAVLLFGPRW